MSSFSERLKQVRVALQLTQTEIAESIGVSQQAWTHYEKERRYPYLQQLTQLVLKYNINLNWLLTGEGEMFIGESLAKNNTTHSQDDSSYEQLFKSTLTRFVESLIILEGRIKELEEHVDRLKKQNK
jgi:transcriptional regulator with XRE-family HTH domain